MSIALAPLGRFVQSITTARTVALTAYTLRPGPVLDALTGAARRGAAVTVRLEGHPLDDPAQTLHADNAAAVAALTAAGATAGVTGSGDPVLHLKAAVVDGIAWLDDRNWAGGPHEHLVRDTDRDDVAAVASAVGGGSGRDGRLATTKARALRLEADVIDRAGPAALRVESESFGNGVVYDRLLARARAGLPTRLIVAGREFAEPANRNERAVVHHLARLGVDIRLGDPATGDLAEKLAVAGGDAWIGSANATYARGRFGAQRDWGLATRAPEIGAELRAAFDANWARARPLPRPDATANPCV
jgi:hypothetical protein